MRINIFMANLNYTFPAGFSIYTHNGSASNTFTSVQNLNGITRIWAVNPEDSTDIRPYIPGGGIFNPSWLTSFVPGSSYQVTSDGTASMQISGARSNPGITLRAFAGVGGSYLGYTFLSMPINSLPITLATATVTKPDSSTVLFNSIFTTMWTPVIVTGPGKYAAWDSYGGSNAFNSFTTLQPGSSYYIDFGSNTGSYILNIPRKNSYLITNNGNYIITNDARYITVSNNA